MCLAHVPQRSEVGEARTRGPSVSSQALYHWATVLPPKLFVKATSRQQNYPLSRKELINAYMQNDQNLINFFHMLQWWHDLSKV